MNKRYIALTVFALYFIFNDSNKVDMHASDVDADCSVVMFTTDWCPVCKSAKSYFERKKYSYCEFDVDKDSLANRYYRELGTSAVPTILIGDSMVVGFYPDEIDELIAELE